MSCWVQVPRDGMISFCLLAEHQSTEWLLQPFFPFICGLTFPWFWLVFCFHLGHFFPPHLELLTGFATDVSWGSGFTTHCALRIEMFSSFMLHGHA